MALKRVVVTGLGVISPLGNNVPDTWDKLVKGQGGADKITRFDATNFKTRFACEVKNFDPAEHFDRKELRKLDPYAQYALVSVTEALEHASFPLETVDKDRVGVIWASGIGGMETLVNELKSFFEGGEIPRFSPFFIPKMIADIAAGLIGMKYGFRGPNFATVSACASSANAIIDAYNYIRLGKADAFVTGGSEAAVTPAGIGGFGSMQAISRKNEEYQTASRPFCATRDGFVLGEGGGAIILEEYEHAVNRGAPIIAEIAGGGLSADAYHLTAPDPTGDGARLVMKNALEDAQINSDEVDYINVHGTATPLGDISELLAIQTVFKEHAYDLKISSTKSMTGHLLGAAGAMESIISILALKNNLVPPTINHQEADERIDGKLNLTLHHAVERKLRYALSNTFGFGGHNASVVFKVFDA